MSPIALEHSAAVALVATAATGALVAILPTLSEVRNAEAGDDIGHDVKTGLFVGAGIVLALAATAALAAKDPLPVIAALVAVATIGAGYLWTLNTRGTEGVC